MNNVCRLLVNRTTSDHPGLAPRLRYGPELYPGWSNRSRHKKREEVWTYGNSNHQSQHRLIQKCPSSWSTIKTLFNAFYIYSIQYFIQFYTSCIDLRSREWAEGAFFAFWPDKRFGILVYIAEFYLCLVLHFLLILRDFYLFLWFPVNCTLVPPH